jgi:uncharacterized membrane protein
MGLAERVINSIYSFSGKGCHRKKERLILTNGVESLLCARCTGMYFGLLLGVLYLVFAGTVYVSQIPVGLLLLFLPLLIDGITQMVKNRTSNNPLRLATGLMAGLGAAPFLMLSINGGVLVFDNYMLFSMAAVLTLLAGNYYRKSLGKPFVVLISALSFVGLISLYILASWWIVRMILGL